MNKTKQLFMQSTIALVLCISMLIGTTFAWFSDSVTSRDNVITSGNLDLEMYWTDELDSGEWHNVEEDGHNTIFSYDNWEPGYTDVKYIKLVNAGELALNYNLSLTPQNGVGELAKVINVYFAEGGVNVTQRSDLKKLKAIGLLNNVLNGGATADGTLLAAEQSSPLHPSGEVIVTMAMNMLTTAGNEYQNKDAGLFTITALATQAPFEEDSFGSDYDTEAKFPTILAGGSATAMVTPSDGKVSAGGVTLDGGSVSAFVPEGVVLEEGVAELTLTITPLKNTTSDITIVNNEILIPVDVHIEGVSDTNDVPIIVDLGEVLPKYLNMGNYRLFHVEDGVNNEMTLVADKASLLTHNQFTYDSDTGAVSVAMATFSEVALIADTGNGWQGETDDTWYDANATELIITNGDQLNSFSKMVGKDNEFANKTVTLVADINLNGKIFYPIGYYNNQDKYDRNNAVGVENVVSNVSSFSGTFNGNGHTISNFYQNTWEMFGDYNSGYSGTPNYYKDAMGLFGYVNGGTIENLTVDHFESDGEFTPTGVIAAYAVDADFKNIAITYCNPRVYNTGNGGIVGVGGNSNGDEGKTLSFTNITIDKTNTISALWGSWDVACGGIMGMFRGEGEVNFDNCHVAAKIDVYNDVCGNYQYYWYRYAGMMIGTNYNMTKDADGYTVPDVSMITAKACTVSFDEWNDYYYCELVDNSIASYTHDYQFSRLTQVAAVDPINMTYTLVDGTTVSIPNEGKYNYVVLDGEGYETGNATCFHFVNGSVWEHEDAGYEEFDLDGNGMLDDLKEDHEHIYLPFNQLFTGYGWGVKHIPIAGEEGSNLEEDQGYEKLDITILNRNYEEKFSVREDIDSKHFLFRVGNGNSFPVGKLFKTKEGADINTSGVHVSVTSLVDGVKMSSIFNLNKNDWTQSTLKISGSGPAKITIQDYSMCTPTELLVEVVDAKNVVSYENLKDGQNSVFLNDITMSSGGTYRLTENHVIYGNGFVFDVTQGAYAGVDYDYMSYVIYLEDSRLDNIQIKGAVYPEIGSDRTKNYNRAIVLSNGKCSIVNSCISNGASPIRNGGDLELVNTTLKGGIYSNLDQRNGHLILDNVTTINQIGANEKYNETKEIVGMGIVVYQEGGTESLKITIRNNLTQYNYLSKTQADTYLTGTYPTAIKGVVFGSDFTDYQNNGWINFAIVSMNNYFTKDDLVDERADKQGYFGTAKTVSLIGNTRDCYVYSFKPTSASTPDYPGYTTAGQGVIEPDIKFDFVNKNYQAKVEGSNDYCYADNGKVLISMDEGDTVNWDTSILSVTKNGNTLDYTVSFDGKDYTGKNIAFSQKGNYEVKYTFTDDCNFDISGDRVSSFSKTYTETLEIEVAVVEASAKHAVFSFGANGTAYSAKTVIIGDKTYVMPDVTATVDGKIGKTTISGTTVYYPITEMYTSDSKTAHTGKWYACFPIFKDAVQIIDYADGGTGDPVTYNQTKVTTVAEIPSTLKATNPTNSFLYQMNATNYPPPTDPTAVNDAVCYTSNRNGLTATNTRTEFTITAEYTYTDNAGTVYYYYVGYHCAEQTNGNTPPCVTPDTLITLEDGTQKRVDALNGSEELLVWNHETGKLDKAPVAYIVDHDGVVSEREIIHLNFANGKTVKIIGEHVFFDATLNKYVAIDSDNADAFIDHTFVALNADGTTIEKVKLVSVERTVEETVTYEVVSYKHLTCFTEGVLSTSAFLDPLLNVFEIDTDTVAYNIESVQKDIETYGLYTYIDFEGLISKEAYELYNAQYLKIAVEKGYITWDDILALIDIYFDVNVQPLQ